MWWLAQQPPVDPGTPVLEWVQFGVLGLVVVGFLTGLVWPKPPVEQLRRDKERLEGEVLTKLDEIHDDVRGLRGERRAP